jgi:hypothetical protein
VNTGISYIIIFSGKNKSDGLIGTKINPDR